MKSNLAQELAIPQGEVVRFPKKERQVMSNKEDGFTPLPNFICDEGYLSALSGDAIKCVVFLNRHVNGFHIDQKSMSESLVMKITGIKDNRTVRKYMSELAKYKLIDIIRERGKSNKYSVTFNDRLPIKLVTSNVPSASNVGTSHVTTPVTSNVPTTSDMACHPVKEIDLKENIKEIHTLENSSEIFSQDDSWKPNLDFLKTLILQSGFSNRANEILAMSGFEFHLGDFNAHWENKIDLTENQKHRKFAKWIIQEFDKSQRVSKPQPAKPNFTSKPKTALQATKDQWAEERFAQQQNSNVIDVNQDQALIGGEREYF